MSKDQFASYNKATGAAGEKPWYIAPQNGSQWTNFRDSATGFAQSPGGGLILGAVGGGLAGDFLGAGAGAGGDGAFLGGYEDLSGGVDYGSAFDSTAGSGGGFGGSGVDYGPDFDTTSGTDPRRGAGGGYSPDYGTSFDSTAMPFNGGGGFGGGAPQAAAFSAGGDGAFTGSFEDLAPGSGGESGAPVGNDPNVPDPDELRKRAAASLAKPPDVTTAGVPSAGSPTGAPTTGSPAAGSGAAPKSFIQKAIDSATNSPLSAASLGFNLYKQSQAAKNGQSAQAQLEKVAQPASDASKKLIEEGLGGNVPAPILTQFNKTAEQQKAAIDSRYANMGRDPNNDSSAAAEKAKIDEARDAQIANYASQLLQQGLTAAGVASAPATQAILAGVNQDKDMQNAMAQMLQQMAFLETMRSNRGGATPP